MSSLPHNKPSGRQVAPRPPTEEPQYLDENGKYDPEAAGKAMAATGRSAGGMGYAMVGGTAAAVGTGG
jgi:hypothetical protein